LCITRFQDFNKISRFQDFGKPGVFVLSGGEHDSCVFKGLFNPRVTVTVKVGVRVLKFGLRVKVRVWVSACPGITLT